jgi:hypothetical protein
LTPICCSANAAQLREYADLPDNPDIFVPRLFAVPARIIVSPVSALGSQATKPTPMKNCPRLPAALFYREPYH